MITRYPVNFVNFGLLLLLIPAAAFATPSSDLKAVIDAHWRWWLDIHPVQASATGDRAGDGRLEDPSLEAADAAAAREGGVLKQLQAIPDAGLTSPERVNKQVLTRLLTDDIAQNGFGERMMRFTTYAGWHQDFVEVASQSPFRTRGDYDSYLARLAAYPKYNQTQLAITRRALAEGFVQPCSVLGNYLKSITGVIADDVTRSRFYAPFLRTRPSDMDDAAWAAMQGRARGLIKTSVEPEYRHFATFFADEYLPKCRKSDGAAAMPRGAEWYALQARLYTTTDLTPDAIHKLGLSEVDRIGAEMDALANRAGYASRAAFVQKLQTDPRYFAKTPAEMLAAAAFQAKTNDGLMPRLFGKLPRLPYGVRAIPAETAEQTTTAYYSPGAKAAGVAGTFYVNTSKLDQRPLWELPALTSHEAVPGHHNQIALQQELDLPMFRKVAVGFGAYVEGWGLYSERLGIELGLYDTPEKEMGRLSYEMWRACRLVVDTGLHSKGWDKAKAVAFMRANTALSDANIDAEVNRYISWPGQALGYKIGQLKFLELRARAEKALGASFDVRDFHDAVLGLGPVPLDVLDSETDAWIASKR